MGVKSVATYRLLAVLIGSLAVALSGARVVGSSVEVGPIIGVAIGIVVGLVGARLGSRWPWLVYPVALGVAFIGAAVAGSLLADGSFGQALTGMSDGPRLILTTEWPSPRWPEVMAAVSGFAALATCSAVLLTRSRRWRLMPIVPLAMVMLGLIAASAPDRPHWLPLTILVASLVLLAVADSDRLHRPSLRLIVGVLIIAGLSASLAVDASARANPRRQQRPVGDVAVLDPIADVVAQRRADPAIQLFRVSASDAPIPPKWRTAALTVYDGTTWEPASELRPIGQLLELDDRDGPITEVSVTMLQPDLVLLPTPGQVVRSKVPLETDTDRRLFRVADPTDLGPITLGVVPMPSFSAGFDDPLVQLRPTEAELEYSLLARSLAGSGSLADQANALASRLLSDFALDPTLSGGLQRKLIDSFLRDTRSGTEEQFVTGFVLMARSIGIDARVATGYDLSDVQLVQGQAVVISSVHAALWAEMRTDAGVWAAIDVIPDSVDVSTEPPPPASGNQTPPAAQPPSPPPLESVDPPIEPPAPTPQQADGWWKHVGPWALRVGVALSTALVLAIVGAALILLAKRIRRRRTLRSDNPNERIRGAWTLASDAMIDGGLQFESTQTNDDITQHSTQVYPTVSEPMSALQRLADVSTFSTAAQDPQQADVALQQLTSVERMIRSSKKRWQRLRWRLSLRSLRSGTRSPLRIRS